MIIELLLMTIVTSSVLGAKVSQSCETWQRPFSVDETIFPFDSQCISLTHGRIHYIDVRPTGIEPLGTILAFHGNPVWSIIFTKVASTVRSYGYRFLALDYYGYGMSDKPDPALFDYKIRSQAAMAAEFMRQLNLTDVFIMVQDGGGPIGLAAAQEEAGRVKGFVIANSWFTETKPITNGTTNENFIFHDWSLDNINNEKYFLATGYNSFNGASGTVSAWQLDPNSVEAKSLTRMMLAPYFENGDRTKPLSDTVHLPHVRLVQSVLQERELYAQIELNMKMITMKPIYLLFADPLAFSALRCDAGPRTRINLTSSDVIKYNATQLTGIRAACPTSFECSDHPPKAFQSKCLNSEGKDYWHALENFRRVWPKERIVGLYQDSPGHEYLSARAPDRFLIAIQTLDNPTRNDAGYFLRPWNIVFLFLLMRVGEETRSPEHA